MYTGASLCLCAHNHSGLSMLKLTSCLDAVTRHLSYVLQAQFHLDLSELICFRVTNNG